MTNFMRGHIGDQINFFVALGFIEILDKANALGVGNRVRKRLGKLLVGWEFENPRLPKLKRRKFFVEHIERYFHRIQHALHIVLMRRIVINRKIDWLAVFTFPHIALFGIARRLH